jgi:hypothetical protein
MTGGMPAPTTPRTVSPWQKIDMEQVRAYDPNDPLGRRAYALAGWFPRDEALKIDMFDPEAGVGIRGGKIVPLSETDIDILRSISASPLQGAGGFGPSAQGLAPGQQASLQPGLWPIPSYSIPSPEFMMPYKGWMPSKEVMAGVMEPYRETERQLMETLGAGGGLGSARGGFSGQGAAGLGKFWAEATPQIGLQAWQMTQPALQMAWQAQLGKQRDIWGEALQQYKYPWGIAPQMTAASFPSPVVRPPSPSPFAGMGSFLGGLGSLIAAF